MIIFEQRASTVLFNLLCSYPRKGVMLLPANICPIVPITLAKAGCAYEFIDINKETLCMDHDAVMKRWTDKGQKPAGILYVRTYGAVFDASATFTSVKSIDPSALIIDDRCLCPPDFNLMLPDSVDIALFSTGHTKSVDVGFGGFGFMHDDVPYTRSHCLFDVDSLSTLTANYKYSLENGLTFVYHNSNWLDTSVPVDSWAEYRQRVERECVSALKHKDQINEIYTTQLPPSIQLPATFNNWRFNIWVNDKAAVLAAIRRENLFASGHYDSLAGVFGLGYAPIAKNLHSHIINLFNDSYFTLEQAQRLVNVIHGLKKSYPGTLFQ